VECLHREHLESSCDVGRAITHLSAEFPHLSFDHLDEVWWHNEGEVNERGFVYEPGHLFEERVDRFRGWLAERPETMIAVVGHGTFFSRLVGRFLNNCEVATLEL
jgi:broad specificity phosphatase PhoE